jgi:hypothetical protein
MGAAPSATTTVTITMAGTAKGRAGEKGRKKEIYTVSLHLVAQ